jgi:hypothetical protein
VAQFGIQSCHLCTYRTTTYFYGNAVRTTELTVPEEIAVARQWQSKHVYTATNPPATIEEPREAEFPVGSVPRLYKENHNQDLSP